MEINLLGPLMHAPVAHTISRALSSRFERNNPYCSVCRNTPMQLGPTLCEMHKGLSIASHHAFNSVRSPRRSVMLTARQFLTYLPRIPGIIHLWKAPPASSSSSSPRLVTQYGSRINQHSSSLSFEFQLPLGRNSNEATNIVSYCSAYFQ